MTDKPCTDNAPPLTEDQVFQLDFITKGTHVSAKALRRHTQCLQSIRGEEFEKIPGSKKHWQAYKCKKCEGHLRVQKSDKTVETSVKCTCTPPQAKTWKQLEAMEYSTDTQEKKKLRDEYLRHFVLEKRIDISWWGTEPVALLDSPKKGGSENIMTHIGTTRSEEAWFEIKPDPKDPSIQRIQTAKEGYLVLMKDGKTSRRVKLCGEDGGTDDDSEHGKNEESDDGPRGGHTVRSKRKQRLPIVNSRPRQPKRKKTLPVKRTLSFGQ